VEIKEENNEWLVGKRKKGKSRGGWDKSNKRKVAPLIPTNYSHLPLTQLLNTFFLPFIPKQKSGLINTVTKDIYIAKACSKSVIFLETVKLIIPMSATFLSNYAKFFLGEERRGESVRW
jgi:hypothetical protein